MEKYKETAFLLLGGNVGEVENTFLKVKERLINKNLVLVNTSGIYKTQAWGMAQNSPEFLNQALEVHTGLSPQALLKVLLEIEEDLGRTREMGNESYANREIDIDILIYGNRVINDVNLQIPHPRISERMFVLKPLNELASNYILPVKCLTVAELLTRCADKLKVERVG